MNGDAEQEVAHGTSARHACLTMILTTIAIIIFAAGIVAAMVGVYNLTH